MNSGELRNKIIIKVQPTNEDSYGGKIEDTALWNDFINCFAAILPISGREFFIAKQVNAIVTTRIKIRYISAITPGMRVVFGGKVYDIKAVLDIEERHKEIHLMCEELV